LTLPPQAFAYPKGMIDLNTDKLKPSRKNSPTLASQLFLGNPESPKQAIARIKELSQNKPIFFDYICSSLGKFVLIVDENNQLGLPTSAQGLVAFACSSPEGLSGVGQEQMLPVMKLIVENAVVYVQGFSPYGIKAEKARSLLKLDDGD